MSQLPSFQSQSRSPSRLSPSPSNHRPANGDTTAASFLLTPIGTNQIHRADASVTMKSQGLRSSSPSPGSPSSQRPQQFLFSQNSQFTPSQLEGQQQNYSARGTAARSLSPTIGPPRRGISQSQADVDDEEIVRAATVAALSKLREIDNARILSEADPSDQVMQLESSDELVRRSCTVAPSQIVTGVHAERGSERGPSLHLLGRASSLHAAEVVDEVPSEGDVDSRCSSPPDEPKGEAAIWKAIRENFFEPAPPRQDSELDCVGATIQGIVALNAYLGTPGDCPLHPLSPEDEPLPQIDDTVADSTALYTPLSSSPEAEN